MAAHKKPGTDPSDEPQHMRALRLANEIRLSRASYKRKVGRGEISPAQLLRASPTELTNMEIGDLLAAQLHWGERRTDRFLRHVPDVWVPSSKRIGSMTPRQRQMVADALETSAVDQVSVAA